MGGGQTQTQKSKGSSSSQLKPWGPTEGLLKDMIGQAGQIDPANFQQFQPGIESLIGGILQGGDNPYTQQFVNSITDASRNAVGGAFSAAGRSFSPSHAAALGKSVTNSLAPVLFTDYRNSLQQLPGLVGLGAQLPYAGLQGQSNFLLPIASQFGKQSGKSTSTQQMTMPGADPLQTGVGAGLGLLGLGLSPMTGGFGNTLMGGLLGY